MSYRDKVVKHITERKGEPLLNGTIDDASVIAQEALSHAQQSIRILSNRLNPDCYAREGVRNAAKFFLAVPGHKLRILIESSLWDTHGKFEWAKHPFVQDVKQFAIGPDTDRRLSIRLVPHAQAQRYKCNFLLLDDFGYRYEADRSTTAAVAAFFPEDEKKKRLHGLDSMFEELWAKSDELILN